MGDRATGRVVDFSVKMTPAAKFEVLPPPGVPRGALIDPNEHPEPTSGEVAQLHRGTRGGLLLMRILSMTEQERRDAVVVAALEDPLVVWWSLISREERAQFIAAAERDLKQRVTE